MLEATPESFDRLMRVNLRGPFFLTQKVARRFVERGEHNKYRCIINISSANAYAASPNRGEYCLSKAATRTSQHWRAVACTALTITWRLHKASPRPGAIPQEVVAAHVRRLEARRRAGIVERVAEGLWKVPDDLPARCGRCDAQRLGGVAVELNRICPSSGRTVRSARLGWISS
ncbi:hypothetical protein GCM10023165_10100 [Variovorax defluvii]|uniref:SDR family NAD(P)-dependent oxidoreductase n=1 Tax=Variovorax defluvii TaxID=913761 RepID=A0ABP8H5F0_9BURK